MLKEKIHIFLIVQPWIERSVLTGCYKKRRIILRNSPICKLPDLSPIKLNRPR